MTDRLTFLDTKYITLYLLRFLKVITVIRLCIRSLTMLKFR